MKNIIGLLFLVSFAPLANCQSLFNAKNFFENDTVLHVILSTDIKGLIKEKEKTDEQKGMFTVKLPDGTSVTEEIQVNARGLMRRKVCQIPPLKLRFNNTTSPRLKSLKNLKLVNSCRGGSGDEQLLLKEYLIYKMFNLISDKSFRVRLLSMTYEDSDGKKKPSTDYAFFVEDVDAMAKRNNCSELNNQKLHSETCDREQMALVDIFQYMIGNTDWSVPNSHNIKLILPKKTVFAKPFVVPYDFDYAGVVNADYAAPDQMMQIENVTQRVYRGYSRPIEELRPAIQVFNNKKEKIYALINDLEPLKNSNKKWIINYLDDFYDTINNEKQVQQKFIDKARK